ncbi:MAG: FkbM family methyltransferase [Nitrospirales bacterium]
MAQLVKPVYASVLERIFTALRRSPLNRLRVITRFYRELIIRFHGTNQIQVGEFAMTVDPRDRFIAPKLIMDGGFEQREIEVLCSFINPGDVVFDVGANIGLYTLPMSRAVGANGTVVSFEPDPDNLRILKHNIAANNCNNVLVMPFALGTEDGEMDLYQVDSNRGYLSFADLSGTGRSVKVRVRRGDNVLREQGIDKPSIVKIDVEGAEPLVISGLGCHPKYIQFEFVPVQLRALKLDPIKFLQQIVSEGYKLFIIDRDTGELHPTLPADLLNIAEASGQDYNAMAIFE